MASKTKREDYLYEPLLFKQLCKPWMKDEVGAGRGDVDEDGASWARQHYASLAGRFGAIVICNDRARFEAVVLLLAHTLPLLPSPLK
jgi:hypothetical protein